MTDSKASLWNFVDIATISVLIEYFPLFKNQVIRGSSLRKANISTDCWGAKLEGEEK